MFKINDGSKQKKVFLAVILVVLLATFVFFIQRISKNFQGKQDTDKSNQPTQVELSEKEMKKQEEKLDKIHSTAPAQNETTAENNIGNNTPLPISAITQEQELDAVQKSSVVKPPKKEETQAQEQELDALFKSEK
jgi:hypothetical protein